MPHRSPLYHRPKWQRSSEGSYAHQAEGDAEQGVQYVTPVRRPRMRGGRALLCKVRCAQVTPLPKQKGKDEGHGPDATASGG